MVTRAGHLPVARFHSLEDAAARIVRERSFGVHTVLKQGRWASSPMEALTHEEKKRLERCLYPSLFDGDDEG